MNFDKYSVRRLRGLILFTGAVILAILRIEEFVMLLQELLRMIAPFLAGASLAFVLNIPLKKIEKAIFRERDGKWARRLRRPVSIVLTLLAVVLVIAIVIRVVVPQIAGTVSEIADEIPAFIERLVKQLEQLFAANPALINEVEKLSDLDMSWSDVIDRIWEFLKNGAGNFVVSTLSVAGGFFSGIVNFLISFVFALYILGQKEKLGSQTKRLLAAYLPEKANAAVLDVGSRLSGNFSSFITGQCLEAVILGSLFVITMLLLRLPYAVLIGVLIGVTALIPIVGAFIGCFVGAFLILVDDPVKALIFLVLFLVLQQLEGNLIYPRVVGSSVGLPAIWVLVAVTLGGSLFGVIGMLVFIPLVSTAYGLLREDTYRRTEGTDAQNGEGKSNREEESEVSEMLCDADDQRHRDDGA
ncbi:MAG: AI-2E family transporter [Lachnospiraceae bacterium]